MGEAAQVLPKLMVIERAKTAKQAPGLRCVLSPREVQTERR